MSSTGRRRDLVLLSGGLDSTVALAKAVDEKTAACALTINYGQRHLREIEHAREIARHYETPHIQLDLPAWGALMQGHSQLTGGQEPGPSGTCTVVPNRNAVLVSLAVSVAITRKCTHVVFAGHIDDATTYADCRTDFIDAAAHLTQVATEGAVYLSAPFIAMPRRDLVILGRTLGAPLWRSWSCYEGGHLHCGLCGACRSRRTAFSGAGVRDPTIYRAA